MTRRGPSALVAVALAAFVGGLMLAACDSSSRTPDPNDPNTLTVLAGSEVKDIEPLLPDLQKATGVSLAMKYSGTLEGAEAIAGGAATDIAWFSSGHYLSLLPGAGSRIVAQEKIMLSPVVMGVKQSVATRFGWANNPNITWKDIEAKSADGSFRFAMTNPAASNSGLVALIGVAAALSGSSDSIDTGTIDKTALRAFFKGQALTAGSSGFLADSYVRDQGAVDGIVNYESILMSLNASGKLTEPLALIYPKEGIVTADYPFMLLNAAKRDAYDKVTAWLRTPEVQGRIMTTTLRRPAIPGVALDPRFTSQTLIELPFPAKLETIDALITAYLDEVRRPASAVFVLDLSGSMNGDRLDQLKAAMRALTGTDPSLTGQFARFRAHEQVTIVTFSSQVDDTQEFTIDDTNPDGPDMTAIRSYIDGLTASGGTAIYDGLEQAYQVVADSQAKDPNRLYSIVLMTDGENNAGVDAKGFAADLAGLAPAVHAVHTYPVLFGEANKDAMTSIATTTGGALFDATTTSLQTIFKQIRGYQ
ncbi:MAG TPA: substrate-binding domain-containing protein [Candidatus Bathyarchaeia archaeon]|jgi:Ca-activated chloride channel family protein|nr:substrate-binding domain-containing protein [Candidatus Bathyarchaeia archaeon]